MGITRSVTERGTAGKATVALPELSLDFALAFAISALLIIAAGATAPEGEGRDWRAYLAAGTIYPLLIAGINLLPLAPRTGNTLRRFAWLATALAALWLFFAQGGLLTIAAAAVTLAVAGELRGARHRQVASHWFAITAAWLATSTMLWWLQPLPQSLPSYWLSAAIAASLAAFLFCTQHEARPGLASRVLALAAPLVFFVAATRSERLGNFGAFHHWSFLAGPAELVRSGGWLLWDVPSQYGFLSTLTIAAMPAANRFQALYLLNVVLLTGCAMFAWSALQQSRSDWLGRLISIVVTSTAFFLVSGSARDLTGPMEYPSTGPFRFLWVYVLLAILLWNFLGEGRHMIGAQIAGGAAWAIGSLWSFESFAYVTATWIPAAVMLALAGAKFSGPGASARRLATLLAGPFLLGLAVGIIEMIYHYRLGHGPDYRGFWEFSFAYAGAYGTLPAELMHPWIALALVLAIGATIAGPLIRARDYLSLSLVASSWGATWSTASYYVARSHPNNVTNLAPIALTATACLAVVGRRRLGEGSRLIGAMAAAVAAFILMITIVNPVAVANAVSASLHGYESNVGRQFPPVDPALADLLSLASVSPNEPMAFLGASAAPLAGTTENGQTLYRARPSLVPAIPSILLDALPRARRLEYLDRYMTSHAIQRCWLVRGRGDADLRLRFDGRIPAQIEREDRVVIGEILRHYKVTGIRANERWELMQLERREARGTAR